MKGGKDFTGVKGPWWAQLIEYTEKELIKVYRHTPTAKEISFAERVLIKGFLQLSEHDRKILIARCGTGYSRSYRRCSGQVGLSHEAFRQQYQRVIILLNKILDEMS